MQATGGADLDAITGGELVEDWWVWWEINKSLYLVPHAAVPAEQASRYATAAETEANRRARISERLLPLLRELLHDDAAAVRAAAATTLGRLGGAPAVEALLPALDDAVQSVREAVLLALGATGSSQAASVLLDIAHDGRVPGGKEEIGPTARPLALVALALGRRHGLDASLDPLVEALLADDTGSDVLEAGLLYRSLAASDACAGLLRKLAEARDLDIRLRCRVTEGLPLDDDTLLSRVTDELASKNTDRRRAAAVTLARSASAFAFPHLQKAFEDEEEPLTRGLMLVSMGSRGGEETRAFLLRQLRRGRAVDRPWVALGLGLLARASGDDEAREALRDGLKEESSAQARGAWILGCGLAQDPFAGPVLRETLAEASDPRLRMFAALALAMLRDEDSLAALRARFGTERSPLARAGVLLAVALQGRPEDAAQLIADVRDANNPLLQAQLASAVGLHDSAPAVDGLEQLLVGHETLSAQARAATLDALGLLLDPREGFQLVHAATQRNFAVFPDWLARALASTTL
jgi:HEAT repeat protein